MDKPPEDKDKQKRTYLLHRNDAERLAEDKRIAEARNRAEKDRRIAEERFGTHREQTEADTKKSSDLKNKLDTKSFQETRRIQDEAILHEQIDIVYSPTQQLKPKPGQKLFPEPEEIKKFRESIRDPEIKASISYDETTGKLIFSGPKGLDALEQYLGQNQNASFGLLCDKDNLKTNLQELKQRGLLGKLSSLEIDGQLIQDRDLIKQQIQKTINWPPRPTPERTDR